MNFHHYDRHESNRMIRWELALKLNALKYLIESHVMRLTKIIKKYVFQLIDEFF